MRNGNEKPEGLRPGMHVDLIVSTDFFKERIDVRRSTIYSMEGNRIILSQTAEPLTASCIGQKMDITFLSGSGNRQVRLGLAANLNAFSKDYKLLSGDIVPALIMKAEDQALTKYNLRMYHRVKPIPKSDIRLIVEGRSVPLSNLSIGGLCYVYPFDAHVKSGNRLSARLEIGGTIFRVDVKVLRIWTTPELKRNGHKFVSVEFANADKRMESFLSGKVLEIERELRSRGLE